MTDTISGFSHLNGAPVQARVTLLDVNGNEIVDTTLSDAGTGARAFAGLPAGRYEEVQQDDGYKARVDGPWVLEGIGLSFRMTEDGNIRVTEAGDRRITSG